jgi:hypothetical protein
VAALQRYFLELIFRRDSSGDRVAGGRAEPVLWLHCPLWAVSVSRTSSANSSKAPRSQPQSEPRKKPTAALICQLREQVDHTELGAFSAKQMTLNDPLQAPLPMCWVFMDFF